MKHILLEVSVVAAVAALIVLGIYLFLLEHPTRIPPQGFGSENRYGDMRIRELEEYAQELAARLDESEDRVARWERSCLAGEVPGYFRQRWESAGGRQGLFGDARAGGRGGPGPWSRSGREGDGEQANAGSPQSKRVPGALPGGIESKLGGASVSGEEKPAHEKESPAEKKYSAGLTGLYHTGRNFDELKLVLTDYEVDFDFADQSPDSMLGEDRFSIRWVGFVRIDQAGTYRFQTLSDDGVRLWVAGRPVVDNWSDHAATWNAGDVYLKEGYHSLRLDFYENGGVATMKLYWSSERFEREIIPPAYLYHDPDLEQKLKKELR